MVAVSSLKSFAKSLSISNASSLDSPELVKIKSK